MTWTVSSLVKASIGALALRRALVASNGGGGDSHRSKMSFCGVKNIDVFGKEDHFAHVTGQLSGVIRCHDRFGLANFSHQGKDVVAGIILLGLVNFRGGHQTHQVIVDLVTFGTTGLDDPVIPLEQTGDECAFGLDNGAPCFAIEFDGNICDSSGRNIFSDILLFRRTIPMEITALRASKKNPVSAGVRPVASSFAISSRIGFFSSIQPKNCQIIRKSSIWLMRGVPVKATSSGCRNRARMVFATA